MINRYRTKVYAGVLGKVIGVFYGRPVEGWPYQRIRERFDIVDHYVAEDVGVPLHVADDDLAGTFTFINALEDLADKCRREGKTPAETAEALRHITAREFGEAWLDYVIENKTIFWWGGLGRSTEHTAYLRLKSGRKAPESGSARTNGKAVSEQIGAQIFMDALALMCPDDPDLARYLVRQSASVSHDGMAVESACFLASMEAMAFSEKNLDKLFEKALALCTYEPLVSLVEDVAENTREMLYEGRKNGSTDDEIFRQVRSWLEEHYGYRLYPGNCHVVPNLALILACLILGEDSFTKAMRYCVSGGWDTDCNGANLGVINGVRLGLDSLTEEYDFREAAADRFYVVSGRGGGCVTDAVRETDRIVRLHDLLYSDDVPTEEEMFSFSLPGAVQGFTACPYFKETLCRPENPDGEGLRVRLSETGRSCVSTLTMWDPADRLANYLLMGSPLLYEGQTIKVEAHTLLGEVRVVPYIIYYDYNDKETCRMADSGWMVRTREKNTGGCFEWKIPENRGFTIKRVGFMAEGPSGTVLVIRSIHWSGAPETFGIRGTLRNWDLGHENMQFHVFTSSAKQFSFDASRAFVVSDPDENGLVCTGTEGWDNYCVSAVLNASIHDRFGIVGRCRGNRRYYALLLSGGNAAELILKNGEEEKVLCRVPFAYEMNQDIKAALILNGDQITAIASGKKLPAEDPVMSESVKFPAEDPVMSGFVKLTAVDNTLSAGAAGFVVDRGTILADELKVQKC